MVSLTRLSGGLATATLAGAAMMAAIPAAQAAPASTVAIPCSVSALVTAINSANVAGSGTIGLAHHCVYTLIAETTTGDGLPRVTGNVTLNGGAGTEIRRSSTAPAFRIFDVAASGTLTVDDVFILNGSTTGEGGGIRNAGTLNVSHSRISDSQAADGGGVSNLSGATATISETTMIQNTTSDIGGGAVFTLGSLTLLRDVLTGNKAPINGGGVNVQAGGVARLIQTTVARNSSKGLGGGLSNLGTLTLAGSQVRNNSGSGGGGIATGNGNVTLITSIVRANAPDNCSPLNTIPGCVN